MVDNITNTKLKSIKPEKISDAVEKSLVNLWDESYKNFKTIVKDWLSSIWDFVSGLDERFIHWMNVLAGKMAKAPYVVSEFLDENKKSISDAIDTSEWYAKYVAYMWTIWWIYEPIKMTKQKISKEIDIYTANRQKQLFVEFGIASSESKNIDDIIYKLKKQDIKFTIADDFIVLESNSWEKIKLKNDQLIASK